MATKDEEVVKTEPEQESVLFWLGDKLGSMGIIGIPGRDLFESEWEEYGGPAYLFSTCLYAPTVKAADVLENTGLPNIKIAQMTVDELIEAVGDISKSQATAWIRKANENCGQSAARSDASKEGK